MDFPDKIDFPAGRPLRLVQITDCHLGEYPGEELLGLNTDQSFHDVLPLLAAQSPDLVVNTGDVSSHGHLGSYSRYQKLVDQVTSAPHAWIPGNHDDPDGMTAAMPGGVRPRLIDAGPWQLILLSSHVPGHEHGDLAAAELAFLDQQLARDPRPALVFLHHQPTPVGSAWIDQYTVRAHAAFLAIIDRQPQVKAVIWGHVHQDFDRMRGPVRLLASPSTCIQFLPDSDDFALDPAMPGLRWFDLHADGRFDTGVQRIAHKDYPIDFASKGY